MRTLDRWRFRRRRVAVNVARPIFWSCPVSIISIVANAVVFVMSFHPHYALPNAKTAIVVVFAQ